MTRVRVRYVVCWTDDAGQERREVCSGAGAYLKAVSLRERLEYLGAYVVRQELRPVPAWCDAGRVDGQHPRRKMA
jgi:hypothetical protein